MYYDKDGLPISMYSWGLLMENPTYRVVKQETLVDNRWVSTVWLGIDHSFGGKKKLLFETMVFDHEGGGDSGGDILECFRWSTLAEAQKGHATIVEELNKHPHQRHHRRKLEP